MPKHIIHRKNPAVSLVRGGELASESQVEISVFPDTYWIEHPGVWLLCHSEAPERAPQVLGVIVRHSGGAGDYAVTQLDGAALSMTYITPEGSDHHHFIALKDQVEGTANRYRMLRVIKTGSIDSVKGQLVAATLSKKLEEPVAPTEDLRIDLRIRRGLVPFVKLFQQLRYKGIDNSVLRT